VARVVVRVSVVLAKVALSVVISSELELADVEIMDCLRRAASAAKEDVAAGVGIVGMGAVMRWAWRDVS